QGVGRVRGEDEGLSSGPCEMRRGRRREGGLADPTLSRKQPKPPAASLGRVPWIAADGLRDPNGSWQGGGRLSSRAYSSRPDVAVRRGPTAGGRFGPRQRAWRLARGAGVMSARSGRAWRRR